MSLPPLSLDQRTFTLKKETNYTVPSTGMIYSWKILNTDLSETPRLFLSDYEVKIPQKDPYEFSVSEIRQYCRAIEYPETPEETMLEVLEATLYGQQLQGIQYYPTLTNEQLYNSIFTKEIKPILFIFPNDAPEEIVVLETYYNRGTNINTMTTLVDEEGDQSEENVLHTYYPSTDTDILKPT